MKYQNKTFIEFKESSPLAAQALGKLVQTLEKENIPQTEDGKLWQEQLTESLYQNGFCSSHQIAEISEKTFLLKYADKLPLEKEALRRLHKNARRISRKAWHLYVSLKTTEGAKGYLNILGGKKGGQAYEFFKEIPSYQDIFGCLEEDCGEEMSVFSPAAYFADLMRIVDKYITEPGMVSGKIPEGCTFPQRRPDLMHLKLNEENSMQEVSYVGLAEKRMAAFLLDKDICEDAQMQELYKNMSGLFYPLELPLQIPKEKIRGYLKEKKTSLEELYEIFGVGREKVLW